LTPRGRSPADLLPSLGRLALEEKERKENWQGLWYAWPNSNLNSFEKVLKTYQNSFQGFKHIQEVIAKV
jgi:hypothetical protein